MCADEGWACVKFLGGAMEEVQPQSRRPKDTPFRQQVSAVRGRRMAVAAVAAHCWLCVRVAPQVLVELWQAVV